MANNNSAATSTVRHEVRESGASARRRSVAAADVHQALHGVRSLTEPSTDRDRLWLALWTQVTTRRECRVAPFGGKARVLITADEADVEVIAAWEWLLANEAKARKMTPDALYRIMRGIATRSANGSARAAQSNQLRGLTSVPGGSWIRFCDDTDPERLRA